MDRALADCAWRTTFPEAYVENLTRNYSNHRPILLRGVSFVPAKRVRPFRFQATWLTHKFFPEVVYKSWDKGEHIVPTSLEHVQLDATIFNKEVFGDIHKRKGTLAEKLKQVQHLLETVDSTHLMMTEASLQKEYNDVLKQEEILWYQKLRENWLKLGDRNTNFFHTQTLVRRKRNKIQGLFLENGKWSTDDVILQAEAINYIKQLFEVEYSTTPNTLLVNNMPHLIEQCRDSLTTPVLKEEVKRAVFSMKSYKASGLDGFQPIFFKHFWERIGDDI